MTTTDDPVAELAPTDEASLVVAPVLGLIADRADVADRTRTIDPAVIEALKACGAVDLAASVELGGPAGSALAIGRELEAVAARCTSTAWCLWNHLGVFHLFAGALGPEHRSTLRDIVAARQWVCFPGGAGSGVHGRIDGDLVHLTGRGAFGSGSRYADWAGVVFAVAGDDGGPRRPVDLRFTIVALADERVHVDPTWDGCAVRASATDDVIYDGVAVDLDRCVPWWGANRAEALREVPVVSHRYREDWVGLSDLWLGWMGVGLARAALAEATASIRTRKAIMGKAMATRPTVQANLGHAAALITAARATMESGCREVDARIAEGRTPDEADYLRQMALTTCALAQLADAMALVLRSSGGNGLREGGALERRWRDFQAMPLHINAHVDRIASQVGRFLLDEPREPF